MGFFIEAIWIGAARQAGGDRNRVWGLRTVIIVAYEMHLGAFGYRNGIGGASADHEHGGGGAGPGREMRLLPVRAAWQRPEGTEEGYRAGDDGHDSRSERQGAGSHGQTGQRNHQGGLRHLPSRRGDPATPFIDH